METKQGITSTNSDEKTCLNLTNPQISLESNRNLTDK
jgi:hypothetical protein